MVSTSNALHAPNQQGDTAQGIGCLAAVAELAAYIDQRHELAAVGDDAGTHAQFTHLAVLRLEGFDDGRQRDHEGLVGHAHHHAVQHRQRQRQAHGEGRAVARP
jgi:hypothetical protein